MTLCSCESSCLAREDSGRFFFKVPPVVSTGIKTHFFGLRDITFIELSQRNVLELSLLQKLAYQFLFFYSLVKPLHFYKVETQWITMMC